MGLFEFELKNLGIIGLLSSGFILDLRRILSFWFEEMKKKDQNSKKKLTFLENLFVIACH